MIVGDVAIDAAGRRRKMDTPPKPTRRMLSMKFDSATEAALRKKAKELGTSQSNAIGVLLGTLPESAYATMDKAGKLITR